MEEVFEHLIDVYNRREANHFMIPFIRNEILPRIKSRQDHPAFLQVEIDKINHYFNVTTLSPPILLNMVLCSPRSYIYAITWV